MAKDETHKPPLTSCLREVCVCWQIGWVWKRFSVSDQYKSVRKYGRERGDPPGAGFETSVSLFKLGESLMTQSPKSVSKNNMNKVFVHSGNIPAVILVEPQLGENIGTSARAMANFGLDDLHIVNPRDGWPSEKASSASAKADFVVDAARLHDTVEDAISDLHFVVATTARARDMVKPVLSPESAAKELHRRIGLGQKCGILFGRERVGLHNDEVTLADAIVIAPVNPKFASLNLAQSVLLMGYEWLKQSENPVLGRMTEFDGPGLEGMPLGKTRPANRNELSGFFAHLEKELDDAGFLRPKEKKPAMIRNLRNMFVRMAPTEQEVRSLRGVISSLTRTHLRKNKK